MQFKLQKQVHPIVKSSSGQVINTSSLGNINNADSRLPLLCFCVCTIISWINVRRSLIWLHALKTENSSSQLHVIVFSHFMSCSSSLVCPLQPCQLHLMTRFKFIFKQFRWILKWCFCVKEEMYYDLNNMNLLFCVVHNICFLERCLMFTKQAVIYTEFVQCINF